MSSHASRAGPLEQAGANEPNGRGDAAARGGAKSGKNGLKRQKQPLTAAACAAAGGGLR